MRIIIISMLLLMTSCKDDCRCIKSHQEYIYIPNNNQGPAHPLNRQIVIVCDSMVCDNKK